MLSILRPEDIERFIGIEGYVTKIKGIGGVIKREPEDFLTWEVLVDGSDARAIYANWRGFSKGLGDQVLAIMKKRRIDTIRACTAISKKLGIKPKMISVCGIKDKMSVSWQFVTIPKDFLGEEGIQLGNLIHLLPLKNVKSRLTSKSLAKNMFEIVIREIEADGEEVKECIEELKVSGLPNFYGHQRFGITRPITPIVGKYMMTGDLQKAVLSFLSEYSPLESEENRKARRRFSEDMDPEAALEYFPRTLRYEREMLRVLAEVKDDYVAAIRALPLRLRRLMVESVSALVFNKALSKIIKKGLLNELEIGDFVVRLDMHGRVEPGRPIEVKSGNFQQIEKLVSSRKFAIALPVPGYLSSIPRSSKGEVLLSALEEVGVSLEMFRLREVPEASTRGSLRPIIVPKWSCEIIRWGASSITLRISLPPGSYATILLREIMKPRSPLAFIGKMDNSDKVEGFG